MATEFFTRWFQYSVFTSPRGHAAGHPKKPGLLPAITQPILADYIHLRNRLLPYRFSFSEGGSAAKDPTSPPPTADFRRYSTFCGAVEPFMFGPALLVSPIARPGAISQAVNLPGRAAWVDFWTGISYAAGQRIQVSTPLRIIPLFAKAGSIIPYGGIDGADGEPTGPIELRVYRGANGRVTLQEPLGKGLAGSPGPHASIPITWNEASRVLKIGARQDGAPGLPKARSFHVVFVRPRHGVGIPETAPPDQVVTYTGTAVRIRQEALPPPAETTFSGLPAGTTAELAFRPRNSPAAPPNPFRRRAALPVIHDPWLGQPRNVAPLPVSHDQPLANSRPETAVPPPPGGAPVGLCASAFAGRAALLPRDAAKARPQ